jgi:uncharacterized protein with ATP-grasp and redox domains
MHIQLDCLPCFLRQALDAARQATNDEELHQAVTSRVCRALSLIDARRPPPAMAQQVHRIIRATIGDDPYSAVKDRMNRLGLKLLRRLRPEVQAAGDPFEAAARIAVSGNCIDFGARSPVPVSHLVRFVESALEMPLYGSATALREAVRRARDILYLADNAGEIALDRLLIEQMPRGTVTVAVRGRAVINDATLHDAGVVGLAKRAKLIDNGSDAPGTLLPDCSPEFRAAFARADLIIAKGQGNYESLAGTPGRPIWFLFVPKCPLVARHVGAPQDVLVIKSPRRRPRRTVAVSRTSHSPRKESAMPV